MFRIYSFCRDVACRVSDMCTASLNVINIPPIGGTVGRGPVCAKEG